MANRFFVAVVSVCSLMACSPQPSATQVDTAAIAATIRADEAQWNADFAARDAARIASHYADNAVLMLPGIPALSGRDNIQAALAAGPLTDHNFSLTFHADDVQVANGGDFAFSRGPFAATESDPRTHAVTSSSGNYVTVWRKQSDGRWLAVADISTPEPSAATSNAGP